MGLFKRRIRNSPEVCAAVMKAIGGKDGAIAEMNRMLGPDLAAELIQGNGSASQETMVKVVTKVVEDAFKDGKVRDNG